MSLTLILIIALCTTALFGALNGYSRGWKKQTVRIVTVAISVILALVLTNVVGGIVFDSLSTMTAEEILDKLSNIGINLFESDINSVLTTVTPQTVAYIIAIPSALVIMPLLFVILFELIKLVMLIPYAIICKKMHLKKKKCTKKQKLFGGLLGAIQGFAIAVILSMPFVGILSTADDILTKAMDEAKTDDEKNAIIELYDKNLAEYTADPVVKLLGTLGANGLYGTFSTVEISGEEYNVIDEISAPAAKIVAAASHFEEFDWKNPTSKNKEGITLTINAVDTSAYLRRIFVDLLDSAATSYKNGDINIEAESHLKEIIDSSFNVIDGMDESNFKTDLEIILDAYFILGRSGVLSAFETSDLDSMRSALTASYTPHELDPYTKSDSSEKNVTIVKKVVEIFNTDSNTKQLVSSISKISVSALASSFNSELSGDEVYETVKSGITETLNITKEDKDEQAYKAEVRASIDTALKNADIVFEENDAYILDNMANYVYDNYDELIKTDDNGNRLVSDDEINDIILSYYDAYLNGEFDTEFDETIPAE